MPTSPLPQPQLATPEPAVGRPPSKATALRNGNWPVTVNTPSMPFSEATANPLGPIGEILVTSRGPPDTTLRPVCPLIKPALNPLPANPLPEATPFMPDRELPLRTLPKPLPLLNPDPPETPLPEMPAPNELPMEIVLSTTEFPETIELPGMY